MRILASSAFIGVHRRPFDCFSRSRGTVLQLSIRRCMRLDERGQREQREIVLVEVVVQVENSRETGPGGEVDRKSTRLNSSHLGISYAVFCLKKNKCPLPD